MLVCADHEFVVNQLWAEATAAAVTSTIPL